MEIIHLILGKANPDRMNGVNKVVYQLATRQADAGNDVKVWGITKDLSHNYGKRNFETVLFKKSKQPFAVSKVLKAAIVGMKGKAVFHLHGGWIPVYSTICKVLEKNAIPFVFTPHGAYNTIAMKRSQLTKSLYLRLFERPLLKRASKIHIIGKSELAGVQSIYPKSNTALIPYGFEEVKSPVLKLSTKELVFGFVGRLDIHTKGLDLLIKAFYNFQQLAPFSKLWIIGDSDERKDLEKLVNATGVRNVTFWGSKFGAEKDDLIRQMHVFVHPSRNEGLPSAVLEAASMGVPCIVSEATNMSTYIDDFGAGISVGNEDIDDLTHAFHRIREDVNSGEYRKKSKGARKMVKESFNWNNLIPKFNQLYS